MVVQKITKEILQRQFLEYRMTRSLSNKLPDVVVTTSQKTNRTTKANLQAKYLVEITRELDKKSPMYSYTIYTIYTWSVLMINNLALMSMCCL